MNSNPDREKKRTISQGRTFVETPVCTPVVLFAGIVGFGVSIEGVTDIGVGVGVLSSVPGPSGWCLSTRVISDVFSPVLVLS